MSCEKNASHGTTATNMETFPACNVYSFIFSDPFASRASGAAGNGAKFPPIPPHKPIYFDPRTSAAITQSRLRHDTLRLAHGVHQRFGTPRTTDTFGAGSIGGPVVLVHLPNSITWPVLVLGFLAAGWTISGTNPGYTATEMAHVIAQCEPRVVICNPGSGGEDVIRSACAQSKHFKVDVFLVDPNDDAYGAQRAPQLKNSWTSLLSTQELQVSPLSAHEANRRVAAIIWTSGTTGKAKGALISHRAVVAGLVQLWDGNPEYTPDERWIAVTPFYHIFGFYNQLLLAPCIGATIIIPPKFDLEKCLRLASAFRATQLHIAPPVAVALAKSDLIDQPWCQLGSVKAAISGGAPLSPNIIRDVWSRLRIPIKLGYGLSELGGVTVSRGDTWDAMEPQLGSVGKLFLGIKVTILGDDGKPVPPGKHGQMIIDSPAQMLGYLNNPQATAETMEARGVNTGDVGYFDEHGNIRIVDRVKEIIKYKGFQVSPTELEGIIASLPEVQDVAVSSVYSEAQGTELPRAYVVPRASSLQHSVAEGSPPTELVTLAEKVKMSVEKHCIYYKYLRGGVTFIPVIPKSPSGKTLRSELQRSKGIHVDCYSRGRSGARL